LASELARSIGKDPSFINSVKKNKPVNGLHLKAVEIILGPQKVLELLSLNKYTSPKETNDIQNNQKNDFKIPQGQNAITALLEIENIDEQTFRRTIADLEFIANQLKKGATPGPLISIPKSIPLGELKKLET
jgi:hypothetical protein